MSTIDRDLNEMRRELAMVVVDAQYAARWKAANREWSAGRRLARSNPRAYRTATARIHLLDCEYTLAMHLAFRDMDVPYPADATATSAEVIESLTAQIRERRASVEAAIRAELQANDDESETA